MERLLTARNELPGEKAPHYLMTNSGTGALLATSLAIWEADRRAGVTVPGHPEMITTSLTFHAGWTQSAAAGYRVVPVDVDRETLVPSVEAIEAAITPRTRVILATVMYGTVPELDLLRKIADEHGLWLVVDAAHAPFARYQGKPLAYHGHVLIGSNQLGKDWPCGEGGFVGTLDNTLAGLVTMIRGASGAPPEPRPEWWPSDLADARVQGHNLRFPGEEQAGKLLSQAAIYPALAARREEQYARFAAGLASAGLPFALLERAGEGALYKVGLRNLTDVPTEALRVAFRKQVTGECNDPYRAVSDPHGGFDPRSPQWAHLGIEVRPLSFPNAHAAHDELLMLPHDFWLRYHAAEHALEALTVLAANEAHLIDWWARTQPEAPRPARTRVPATVPAVAVAEPPPATDLPPLTACFVGTGENPRYHMAGYRELLAQAEAEGRSLELVFEACCDEIEGKAARFAAEHGIPHAYRSIDEVLAHHRPDVWFVCTPPGVRRQCVLEILEKSDPAPALIVLEKPFDLEVGGLARMQELAKGKGVLLNYGLQLRHTAVSWLRKLAADGFFGDIRKVSMKWLRRNGIPPRGVFAQKKLSGGGPGMDLLVHILDMVMSILGYPKIRSVTATTRDDIARQGGTLGQLDPAAITVEDAMDATFYLEGGGVVNGAVAWDAHAGDDTLTIEGEGSLGGWKLTGDPTVGLTLTLHYKLHGVLVDAAPWKMGAFPTPDECYAHAMADHIGAALWARGRRSERPSTVTDEEARGLLGAVLAAYESADREAAHVSPETGEAITR